MMRVMWGDGVSLHQTELDISNTDTTDTAQITARITDTVRTIRIDPARIIIDSEQLSARKSWYDLLDNEWFVFLFYTSIHY